MPTTFTKSGQMRNALLKKFAKSSDAVPIPEHLVVFEVAVDGRERYEGIQGFRARQRIDAVTVGMVSRTEHLVQGFEIKVSRSDLLSELKDPSKVAAGVAACDKWWLALGDARLLKDSDDVPENWGIIAPVGKGLRVLKEPVLVQGERDSRFWAAVLQAELRSPRFRFDLGRQAGFASAERWWKHQVKSERFLSKLNTQHEIAEMLKENGHYEASQLIHHMKISTVNKGQDNE